MDFEQKVEELSNLAQVISYKKVKISYSHKNLIFLSTVVLLSAALEEYFRCFVDDLFYRFKVGSAPMTALHPNTRTYAILSRQQEAYRTFLFKNMGEIEIMNRLSISRKVLYEILDDNAEYTNHITAKEIVQGKKYSNTRNIKILYNRLGISDIFAVINKKGHKDYRTLIDSFLDIRTTISHASPMSLTILDVRRCLSDINDVVNRLDREMYSHCCKYSGIQYWPQNGSRM